MLRKALCITALVVLGACDGTNPFDNVDIADPIPDDPANTNGVPEAIANNLQSLTYNQAAGTLTVQITSLDSPDLIASYALNPTLNVPGYIAYSLQDDPLDRMFVALVAQSVDGEVIGGVVVDGGQFTRYFGGAYFERTGSYSAATANGGLVSYAGTYAGITNISAPGTELLPVPAGTDPEILPGQPARVTGDVFINADFADNTINGAITNRVLTDFALVIPSVFLIPADIETDGSFGGTVENSAQEGLGTYAGVFAR